MGDFRPLPHIISHNWKEENHLSLPYLCCYFLHFSCWSKYSLLTFNFVIISCKGGCVFVCFFMDEGSVHLYPVQSNSPNVGAILSLQLECKGMRKPGWIWTLSGSPTAGLWNRKKYNRKHRQNVMHFLIDHCYSQIINISYLRYWGGRPHKVRISHRHAPCTAITER